MKAPVVRGLDTRAMLQDLKGNRRVQGALVLLAAMAWYLWPGAGPAARRPAASRPTAPLSDRQAAELGKLPDLARLDQAGALPADARMLRDLFLFEGPAIPPPPPRPEPPPPSPTPEQLAARERVRERARQAASRPQGLRYLGYLESHGSGRLGAFMKGEEPVTWKQGALVSPQWRLVTLDPAWAEFRNERFADLTQRVEAADARGGGATTARAPDNDF